MINAAADAVFFLTANDSLQKYLRNLITEISSFAARRNEIAHGKITTYYRPAGLFELRAGHRRIPAGYVLGPAGYATNKTTLKPGRIILETAFREPRYAYSSIELTGFQTHFERLAEAARRIGIKVMQHQYARKKSSH